MPEILNAPQHEQVASEPEDLFGQVGVEGLAEVLRWKLRRQQEQERILSPEERAEVAISKVEDPQARQALTGDIADVVRVMSAVDTIRAEGTEENPITDRDIYIAYRKLTEAESPDPRFEQACKILLNFMGGKISGKLPF